MCSCHLVWTLRICRHSCPLLTNFPNDPCPVCMYFRSEVAHCWPAQSREPNHAMYQFMSVSYWETGEMTPQEHVSLFHTQMLWYPNMGAIAITLIKILPKPTLPIFSGEAFLLGTRTDPTRHLYSRMEVARLCWNTESFLGKIYGTMGASFVYCAFIWRKICFKINGYKWLKYLSKWLTYLDQILLVLEIPHPLIGVAASQPITVSQEFGRSVHPLPGLLCARW